MAKFEYAEIEIVFLRLKYLKGPTIFLYASSLTNIKFEKPLALSIYEN